MARKPYSVTWPINGSGKRSPVARVRFTVAGKRYDLSTGESDPGRAEQAAASAWIETCRRARVAVPAQDLTLAQVAADWLADVEDQIKRGRIVRGPRYLEDLTLDSKRILTHFDMAAGLTSAAWEDALAAWHDGYPDDGGVSWRYLQRLTVTARKVLRHACGRLKVLTVVPELTAPSNEQVRAEQRERRAYSEEERNAFLSALARLGRKDPDARRAWRIFTIFFFSALRKSGLERLHPADVDQRTGYARLRKTKNGKPAEVWMHPRALAAIKEELALRKVVNPREPIFPKIDLRHWFRTALAAAKIDPHALTPHHATRHTAATIAGDKGATLSELLALGTWETPAMAMRYMHEDGERSKRALRRLGR